MNPTPRPRTRLAAGPHVCLRRRVAAVLAAIGLASATGCAANVRRPALLLAVDGSPDPAFVQRVADLLDVDLLPSFADRRALLQPWLIHQAGIVLDAECRWRGARGIVWLHRFVAGNVSDVTPYTAVVGTHISISGCSPAPLAIEADTAVPFHAGERWIPGSAPPAATARAYLLTTQRLALLVERNASLLANLRRTGIALADGSRSTLCTFSGGYFGDGNRLSRQAWERAWTVEACDPRGPAARAGLRSGDKVVRVNGVPATARNLTTLGRAADAAGAWDVVYERPTGEHREVRYAAHDVDWLAAHVSAAPLSR